LVEFDYRVQRSQLLAYEPSEENSGAILRYALARYGGDWRILKAAIRAAPGGVLRLKWHEGAAKGTITVEVDAAPPKQQIEP
jgi:hypothetical protein